MLFRQSNSIFFLELLIIFSKIFQTCGLAPKNGHGGHFKGNDCHKLLKNIDILRRMTEKACAYKVFGPIETFQRSCSSCFGKTLKESFKIEILKFKTSFQFLPISVTPKVHTIFYHFEEFLLKHQSSLRIFSEQATERLHSKFNAHWE